MKHIPILFILFFSLSIKLLIAQETVGDIVWYPPVQLSDPSYPCFIPSIALCGDDTINITYFDGGERVPYVRSIDGGKTFERIRYLFNDTSSTQQPSIHEKVVTSNDLVYIFYIDSDLPYLASKIRMVKSTNRGETFSVAREIGPDLSRRIDWATIHGDTLALIYYSFQDERRRILYSTNQGISWSKVNQNLNLYPPYSEESDRICFTRGMMHMVQEKAVGQTNEIIYLRSPDFGRSWEKEKTISVYDGFYSDVPTIAGYNNKCGSELLVAWRDTKYGVCGFAGGSILSRIGLANGKLWLPEVRLTAEPNGFIPEAKINNNARAVSWAVEYNCNDTFHLAVRATNSSLTKYEPITDMAPLEHNAGNPSIALSSHAIHVVYEQQFQSGDFRIIYRRGEFIQHDVNFALSTGVVEFDSTDVGESLTKKITVFNSGKEPLTIGTAVADDLSYSSVPTSAIVNPKDSVHFSIRFTPVAKGPLTGKILFYHNGRTSPDCITVTGTGRWGEEKIAYSQGWQLVSIPLKPGPKQSLPSMFAYDAGYIAATSMQFGKGYWAKPPDTVSYWGGRVFTDTIIVKRGWNLVGGLSDKVSLTTVEMIPTSIIESQYYEYTGQGYRIADFLQPGKAYWVKAKEDGVLVLRADSNKSFGKR